MCGYCIEAKRDAVYGRTFRAASLSSRFMKHAEGPHPLDPHPCACHRDPAAPRLRRGKRSFSPRTWSGWIPVTSTGMRKANKRRRRLQSRHTLGHIHICSSGGSRCHGQKPALASSDAVCRRHCLGQVKVKPRVVSPTRGENTCGGPSLRILRCARMPQKKPRQKIPRLPVDQACWPASKPDQCSLFA